MVNNKLIKIKPYAKPKKNGSGGASNITYNISETDIGGDLNLKSLQANRIVTEYLEANNIQAGNTNTVNLVASDGTISSLRGDNLNYASGTIGDLNANNINTRNLTVDDTATIRNIFNKYLNSKEIVTDYLTVNKSAHFFELVIDKIRSVGGTIINTATSCVLDFVEPVEENGSITKYRCYWKQTNDDGDYVSNDWMVNDQAISQNCNLVAGINHDAGNHYYWRLVVGKQDETVNGRAYVNFTTGEVKNVQAVDGQYDAPKYEIIFVGSYVDEEQVEHQVSGFHYNNGEGEYIGEGANRRQNPYYDFTDWTYVSETGQEDWDGTALKLTVQDTLHGLELLPNKRVDNVTGVQGGVVEYDAYISAGTLEFCTDYPTRLNTIIFYDDETIEFHAAPEKGQETTHYVIDIEAATNAVVRKIVILSDEVNIWHACHWIELGNDNTNGKNEYDVPDSQTDFGSEVSGWDNKPAKGDNIAQLGYRYGENPTADEQSRASAIIIAAYKTPDSGGTIDGKIIQPIKPPSYAQYQNITDFNLFTHRGTYMDASGAYFKGNLVSESGDIINIGDDLTVDTEYYQLISNENPITRPSSGTKNITFRILYVHNGEGTILSSLPTGWHTRTSLDNYANDDDLTITINSNTQSLEVRLYNENNNLKDTYVATTINLSDVTDGEDGAYNQWIYRNGTASGYDTPTSTPSIPTGWSTTPQPITASKPYTWMSTRTVTPSNTNPYGPWSTPIRITGDNGQAGEDGDFTEFIYTRNDTGTAPAAPPHGTYARDWPNNGTVDHQTVNGVTWYDRPQGVQADIRYEYVSSREYNGTNKTWTDYSTPVVWAKYGEKGMDGDGVEYIFKAYNANPLPSKYNPGYTQNTSTGKYFTDDDYYPNGWADDPMSPTESLPYVFVSQRKQVNGEWVIPASGVTGTPWSTPALWARYTKDGTNGEPGAQGNPGEDGVVDKLVPYIAQFEVRTTSTNDYNDIISQLYANLQYQVWHADGDVVSQVTGTGLNNYSIRGTVRAVNRDILTYNLINSAGQDGFILSNNMFKLTDGSNYYMTNMLDHLGYSASAVYHDYRKLSQSSSLAGNFLPIEIYIELLYNNQVVDSKVHEVIFKAGHVFEVTDSALNSAFFGSWKGEQGIVDGMSSIRQDMTGIQTNVSTLSTSLNGLQSDYSTFKQTAQGFQTQVTNDYYDGNGDPTITTSIIDQRAGSISAGVQTNIENRLNWTGINIQGATSSNPGTITLRGDKTIFSNSAGTKTGVVQIDTNTAELKSHSDYYGTTLYMKGGSNTAGIVVNGPVNIEDGSGQAPSGATYVDLCKLNIDPSDADALYNAGQLELSYRPNSSTYGSKIVLNPYSGLYLKDGSTNINVPMSTLINTFNRSIPVFNVTNTSLWDSGIGSKNTIEHLYADYDIYVFTNVSDGGVPTTANGVFDMRSSGSNQGTGQGTWNSGLRDGRVISIHGYPGLCLCAGTSTSSPSIMLKNTYWNSGNYKIVKFGSVTDHPNTFYNNSSLPKGYIDTNKYGYCLTLAYYSNNWWEI